MSHPASTEWMQLLDGEVTANRAAAMQAHAAGCADCDRELGRLRGLVGDLRRPVDRGGDGAVDAVMARIAQEGAQPAIAVGGRRRRATWLAAGGALAAAAAIVILIVARGPGEDRGEFTPRGGGEHGDELTRQVGFDFFAGTRLLTEGASIERDVALSARYRNLFTEPVYALVFVLDAANEVHWLYPAFTDSGTVPLSVRLAEGARDKAFGESVVLDQPAVGVGTIIAIVSREPMTVAAIESLRPGERLATKLGDRWRAASVQSFRVRLLP